MRVYPSERSSSRDGKMLDGCEVARIDSRGCEAVSPLAVKRSTVRSRSAPQTYRFSLSSRGALSGAVTKASTFPMPSARSSSLVTL